MGGKRTTKEELAQLEALTKEALTCREIAQKLDRSPAAIRNLRYKKRLVSRVQDETKALLQQRDELNNVVKNLQGQKRVLAYELDHLKIEKEKLEAVIAAARNCLQETLAQRLMSLKQQRPDLFTITGEEQMARLLEQFLKGPLA
jgi:DNA-binding protein Fis